ncbi:bifunctional phosphoribosyl-AMP cyclohydrolase/phosphoribosyl-ATP diphosphatase HisIE [Mesobacillus maritimus]|uniref:bifunctional phosphoribosyl-AMP cyclohydrolase/phosphoribosyl-ATP diphosphatase HisIE n=1 Tax=Mesobacillus maritimus TaxID=1643336 RepID=UPI00203ABCE8|nr:bifunctional phosphoribosyl-AMP cyclohydrolase/phosphoribosyl-ATP diphosphatase HisIE [Mesobacillus maritimus]MCM3585137.1 bifunctional phosphoribosyl-AMP cyclohydrolase/phosphoribosyl-ATP diphosphatase HisIE [Mesobacillus maritimus]MCM3668028.1 bifunctional phosphoribosyl-AMP cyclohydrolase/phosphoribosyl-ATP diphosphatase HisIE [Mesobacillus maritimus]
MNIENLKFDEKGLITAVVQDALTREVLTVAYMNQESLEKSLETRETWFYSRSRQELWHKGETSGNTQRIVEIKYDCDGDALVVLVEPAGPACHTGSVSCFSESLLTGEASVDEAADLSDYRILKALEQVIADRERERPEGAYTTYLFEKGVDKILKKVGEEASEVIIAAKNRDQEELKWESADLLYHLLVLLREQELPFKEVLGVLDKRHMEKK